MATAVVPPADSIPRTEPAAPMRPMCHPARPRRPGHEQTGMSDDELRDPAGSRRELLHGHVLRLPADRCEKQRGDPSRPLAHLPARPPSDLAGRAGQPDPRIRVPGDGAALRGARTRPARLRARVAARLRLDEYRRLSAGDATGLAPRGPPDSPAPPAPLPRPPRRLAA